jgi:hypothetical protein
MYEAIRSRSDGFGSGARNAMEKSTELLGELGVTIIAGRSDFSSTKGKVRSTSGGGNIGIRLQPNTGDVSAHLRAPG